MAAGSPGPPPPGEKSKVKGCGAAGELGTLSCLAARRPPGPPPPGTHRTSPSALPCPTARSRANEEVGSRGRKPSRVQCLRRGCPILTQEDALTAAKRSPPARYLRFGKGLRNFQRSRSPEPTARLGPRGSGSPEGVKKFAQLGRWARRGRGACPGSRGRSRLPGAPPGASRAGVGLEEMKGFRGALGANASLGSPRPRCQRRLPEHRAGVPLPLGEGCGASPARSARTRPRRSPAAGRAGAENHTSARLPDACAPSPPSAPASPGRDRLVGLAHLNLDRPRGTGAASPEKAFSSARATAGWGERARRELQQVSLALLPCPAQEPR